MCDALRELMKDDLAQAKNEGKIEGRLEGKLEGIQEGKLESLTHVMKSFSVDAEKAMDVLHIPAAEREIYRSKLL